MMRALGAAAVPAETAVSRRPLSGPVAAEVARLVGDAFFASPGFAEVWRHMGGRPVAWIAEAGGRVAAALPGVEFGRGPLARFHSMPDGCYGGVYVDPAWEPERAALAGALLDAVVRRGYVKTYIADFHRTVPEHPGFTVRPARAMVVDIGEPDWGPADAKLRSQIRKGHRERVRHERFVWDRHHRGFLRLMRDTEARHGQPPRYTDGVYRTLAALAERDPRVRWVWCERGGEPVCSHIYFMERGVLQAWQSYYNKAFSSLKPNQTVRYDLCRSAARTGVRRMNLGATPPRAVGLAYYKARWGGRWVSYPVLVRLNGLGRWI
jgi:CelD/BcsL family acetyltransferase involved in cellulose biosynthesis